MVSTARLGRRIGLPIGEILAIFAHGSDRVGALTRDTISINRMEIIDLSDRASGGLEKRILPRANKFLTQAPRARLGGRRVRIARSYPGGAGARRRSRASKVAPGDLRGANSRPRNQREKAVTWGPAGRESAAIRRIQLPLFACSGGPSRRSKRRPVRCSRVRDPRRRRITLPYKRSSRVPTASLLLKSRASLHMGAARLTSRPAVRSKITAATAPARDPRSR